MLDKEKLRYQTLVVDFEVLQENKTHMELLHYEKHFNVEPYFAQLNQVKAYDEVIEVDVVEIMAEQIYLD